MAAFFLVIALFPLTNGNGIRTWALICSGCFFCAAAIFLSALTSLNRLWMRLGTLLNRIVSPVALGVVYFLAVVPVGILMKLMGKDLLQRRFDSDAKTYWIDRKPPGPDPKSLTNQF